MNWLAVGVDDPHLILPTIPWASAAFMNAGAVSGVKLSRMPPPSPAYWYIWRSCDPASVTGRGAGKLFAGTPFEAAYFRAAPSEYAATESGEAIAIFFTPA